jgi:curved DNA-binding protein CbpA
MDEGEARAMRKKMMARSLRAMGSGGLPPAPQEIEGAVQEQKPAGSAAIDVSQLSAEDKLFVEEVRLRAKRAHLQNAYVRLGLTPEATGEQIKKAYLDLAKRFHPDRASTAGLGPLLSELQTVFRVLKDGYEQISSPAARDKYDKQLKAGGKPSRKEESATAVKMGEVLLKKRDFDGAVNKLRHAVDLDASGDALAALAWALVSDPKSSPATKEEAAALIQRALRSPGVTARTYYVAGVLWRTKDPDSAVDAFRKALELDANHPDAALELRLIEQRRGKQQKSGGGVLSGLLFGKRKS